ncbi:HEPN domain-containing protein [Marinomonas agarivorans]|nr:HEPN domain-containing protein [Marinomonas agarivorans]
MDNLAIDLACRAPIAPSVTSPFVLASGSAPPRDVPSLFPSQSTVLAHLSSAKQQELQQAVALILASVKSSHLGKLVLFGSYARGDWVDTPEYQSHFDILAVMKSSSWARKLEGKKTLQRQLKQALPTPVNLVADDVHYINRRIQQGVYFYMDMFYTDMFSRDRQRDGIVLYDSGQLPLAEPSAACLQQQISHRKQQAQADFSHWFGKAMAVKKGFELYWRERDYSEAAFQLHQLVERLYGVVLLVFGRFRPNSHDLAKLGRYTASLEPQFLSVFPQRTAEEKAAFALLQKAYVSARYQPSFRITENELAWLAERAAHLQSLTEQLCHARIASYS